MNSVWRTRWNNIVEHIYVANSDRDEESLLRMVGAPQKPTTIAFVNAHAMNTLAQDEAFYSALIKADILLRDGQGMQRLFRMLKRQPGLNMNGTDFIPKLLKHFNGRTLAIWGTQTPFLDHAIDNIETSMGGKVISRAEGFSSIDYYVSLALSSRPELIVLGMGMPKQEQVASAIRDAADYPVVIVCGGAIIDFLGGRFPRAPLLIRRMGLEWCFRLMREPRRLFGRYVIGNPRFLLYCRALTAKASPTST